MLVILLLGHYYQNETQNVNANTPPLIHFLAPSEGKTLSGIQEIQWIAFDSDFDNLTFSMRIPILLSVIVHDNYHLLETFFSVFGSNGCPKTTLFGHLF